MADQTFTVAVVDDDNAIRRLLRLFLKAGREPFIGYYSGCFYGWASACEDVPLIRGAIAFAGWQEVDQGEARREAGQTWRLTKPKRRNRVAMVIGYPIKRSVTDRCR